MRLAPKGNVSARDTRVEDYVSGIYELCDHDYLETVRLLEEINQAVSMRTVQRKEELENHIKLLQEEVDALTPYLPTESTKPDQGV